MSAESPAPETSVVVDQPIQLVAKVVDGTNAPLDQVTVYWWLTSGKASLSADTTETDTNGAATITVKVPTAGGELPATVVASLDPKGSPGPRKTEFKLAKP
jgi:hypothetical protein